MAASAPLPPGKRGGGLSLTMVRVLWQIAQHKYGWGYINGIGHRSAARGLKRRGLIALDEDYRATFTAIGELEACRRWPNSPTALQSYMPPSGGWDRCSTDA